MDLEILKEDSIVKVVSNLSTELSNRKPFSSKSDLLCKRKEIFKMAYGTLLNKRSSDVYDKRKEYRLDELIMEILFFILHRNREHITSKLKCKISEMADRLGELARIDLGTLETVKSVLRILLVLRDYLPSRPIQGILKYKEPLWFPVSRPERSSFHFDLKSTIDLNANSMMCIKGSNESLFCTVGKMKKSATWHEDVMNVISRSSSCSSFGRPSSQTLVSQDEGFVTPDDNHREETPELLKEKKLEPGWWCRWDIVRKAPSQYKTWESQGLYPVVEEDWDLFSSMKLSYDFMRSTNQCKGALSLPPAQHFVTLDNLVDDIVCLLCGLPSSSFTLGEGNKFKLVEGTYTTGIMPNYLPLVVAPYIKFGETFSNLESFVHNSQCFNESVPQAFLQSLGNYLYELKSLLLKIETAPQQERMKQLRILVLKPSQHLSYLWNIINVEGSMSFHRILERMHSSLPLIHDEELLTIVNSILVKCCNVYISLLEKYITRGVCSEEIMSSSSCLSVEKVPAFLRSLTDIINNSSKTLHLFHENPQMYLLESKEAAKEDKVDIVEPKPCIDHQEVIKQRYIKFMKEKEEERLALAKKKNARLERVKEDIARNQEWKELEAMELELRDRKIQDSYDKLDAIKQQYLQDCVKEVESKYQELIRESDKKIAVANWKLKRLAGESARKEVIMSEELENKNVHEMFLKNGIDLSEENRDLIASPIEASKIEIKRPEAVAALEDSEEVLSRHDEALEIKKRMMEGDDIWKNMDYIQEVVEKPSENNEIFDGMKIYEENRNKALEIKKKIMSSELELDRIHVLDSPNGNGLSPEELKRLEDDLTVFMPPDHQVLDPYIKTSYDFLNAKKKLVQMFNSRYEKPFQSEPMDFIQINNVFLKSAKNYLKNELRAVNKIMLEHLLDDFIKEVRWISDHYLLMNGVWSGDMIKKLVAMLRRGSVSPLSLSRLFPSPLSVRNSEKSLPVLLDPCDPSSLGFIILIYQPQEPLHHFIREHILLNYNKCFLHLVKIEVARLHLQNSVMFMKNRYSKPDLQYNKINMQLFTMSHFIASLKTFVCNSFEKCWQKFLLNSARVSSLDDLHLAHIKYLRNIQFLCLQQKRLTLVRDILSRLLNNIYKYCETLKGGVLSEDQDGSLTHSLYPNLLIQFKQYLIEVRKIYSIITRYTESGISDNFSELVELLSINNFYQSL